MYKKFRFIGLEVFTSAVRGINTYPDIPLLSVDERLPYDIKNRLRKMANAVDLAYRNIDNSDNEVLNVFTLPEFYFRPYDAHLLDENGYNDNCIRKIEVDDSRDKKEFLNYFAEETSYSFAQMQNIYSALLAMFRKNEFKNWLFLPGTIFSKLQTTQTGDVAYLNTLPVIKGGEGSTFATTIQKKLISWIDGADTEKTAYFNNNLLPILNKLGELESNIFSIDNLSIGVEVCLDHCAHADYNGQTVQKGVLKAIKDKGKLPGNKPLDLQVLIACGMGIEPAGVVGRNVLRNDGMKYNRQSSNTELRHCGMVVAMEQELRLDSHRITIFPVQQINCK